MTRYHTVYQKRPGCRNWAGLLFLLALVSLSWEIWRYTHRPPPALRYLPLIRVAAWRHGLDPILIQAVIRQESKFQANARGTAGEMGLMQITPGVVTDWERCHHRKLSSPGAAFAPRMNLEIGCWHLARALRQWQNHPFPIVMALAQYNAGRKRALRWAKKNKGKKMLEHIPFSSTRAYISHIFTYWNQYQRGESKISTESSK